jgi:hypothetical protein
MRAFTFATARSRARILPATLGALALLLLAVPAAQAAFPGTNGRIAWESTRDGDAASDQYTYVWKTLKGWASTCRQLVVKLTDGTSHRANFMFK